jgi:hypothetical protein
MRPGKREKLLPIIETPPKMGSHMYVQNFAGLQEAERFICQHSGETVHLRGKVFGQHCMGKALYIPVSDDWQIKEELENMLSQLQVRRAYFEIREVPDLKTQPRSAGVACALIYYSQVRTLVRQGRELA